MSPAGYTLGILALIGIGALVLRAFSGGSGSSGDAVAGSGRATQPAGEDDEVDPLDEPLSGELAPVTSDGTAFLPNGGGIAIVPVGASDPDAQVSWAPRTVDAPPRGDTLVAGDLIAARVRRGAPDHDPWRIEALGRDRELIAWRFETEDAARAALVLLDARIVRAPRDEHGDPIPIGDAEFTEARRIEEETERELAQGGDEPYEDDSFR